MSLAVRQRHGQNYYYFRKGAKKILYLGPVDRPGEIKQERVLEALDYSKGLDSKNVKLEYHLLQLLTSEIRDEYVSKRLAELDAEQNDLMIGLLSEAKQKKYLGVRLAELQTRLRQVGQITKEISDALKVGRSGTFSVIEHGSKSLEQEDRDKPLRESVEQLYHDYGLKPEAYTTNTSDDSSIDHQMAETMNSIRKWHTRSNIVSPQERRLSNVLTKINETCAAMSLPKMVVETATIIYRNFAVHTEAKGKSIASMAAATIYLACKKLSIVRSLEEIVEATGVTEQKELSVKLASKYYRMMLMELGIFKESKNDKLPELTFESGLSIEQLISRIGKYVKTDTKVERLAIDLAHKTISENLTQGKDPKSIAAAYVLIASTLLGQNLTQEDVADILSMKQSTIRERIKEIMSNHKFIITVRETLRSSF